MRTASLSRVASIATMVLITAIGASTFVPARPASAGSEKPSGVIIFPRVEVDSAQGVDTLVQISSADTANPASVFCFYVNALGSCASDSEARCREDADCSNPAICVRQCQETDFIVTLSPGQTIGFRVNEGLFTLPQTVNPVPDPGAIPPAPTDPFLGELKCVQIDATARTPVADNDLLGNATIIRPTGPDAAAYSAIGLESTGRNNGDTTLCVGSNATGECMAAEYVRCPSVLTYSHFFEGAVIGGAEVQNELTLVPCSESFGQNQPPPTAVQVLVFNEFEERRCGSFAVSCVGDIQLGDSPLFSVGLQGTLAGQTRMRPVPGGESDVGHAMVGIALERYVTAAAAPRSAVHHLTAEAASAQADFIRIPELDPLP